MISPCSILKIYKPLAKICDRYFIDSFISFTGKINFYDKWFHVSHKFYASTSILQYSSSTKTTRSPTFLMKIGEVYRIFRLITGFKIHVL